MDIDLAAARELHPKEYMRLSDQPDLASRIGWLVGYCAAAFLALLLLRWLIRAVRSIVNG